MKLPGAMLALILLLVVPAASLLADPEDELDQEVARRLMEKGVILPLQRIVEKVEGHILEVELEYEHGHYLYELEILQADGAVVERIFDATTGEPLEKEELESCGC